VADNQRVWLGRNRTVDTRITQTASGILAPGGSPLRSVKSRGLIEKVEKFGKVMVYRKPIRVTGSAEFLNPGQPKRASSRALLTARVMSLEGNGPLKESINGHGVPRQVPALAFFLSFAKLFTVQQSCMGHATSAMVPSGMTAKEAAALVNKSTDTVYRWKRAGIDISNTAALLEYSSRQDENACGRSFELQLARANGATHAPAEVVSNFSPKGRRSRGGGGRIYRFARAFSDGRRAGRPLRCSRKWKKTAPSD
jgi:hypothetical protein